MPGDFPYRGHIRGYFRYPVMETDPGHEKGPRNHPGASGPKVRTPWHTLPCRKASTVNGLERKSTILRNQLPRNCGRKTPQDTGIRLATFRDRKGSFVFRGTSTRSGPISGSIWNKSDTGSFCPIMGQGLLIKIKAPHSRERRFPSLII